MAGVQQQVARIDKFLAKEMLESPKSEEEIQTMRTNQCVEVTIQGSNTVLMSIEEQEEAVGLQEVVDFFCSLGRTLTLSSIQSLARD